MEAATALHQLYDKDGFEERFKAHKDLLTEQAKENGWNQEDVKNGAWPCSDAPKADCSAGDLLSTQATWLTFSEPVLSCFAGLITVIPDFFHSHIELIEEAQRVMDNLCEAQAGCHAFVLGAYNHWVCLVCYASPVRGLRFFFLDSANTKYTSTDQHKERQTMIQTLLNSFTQEKSLAGLTPLLSRCTN